MSDKIYSYETVSEAMSELAKRGYTADFSVLIETGSLVSHHIPRQLSPAEFEIDEVYRFEGETDPGDEMIVYAISSKEGELKGIVVNAYGIYADQATSAIVKKLDTPPEQVEAE